MVLKNQLFNQNRTFKFKTCPCGLNCRFGARNGYKHELKIF